MARKDKMLGRDGGFGIDFESGGIQWSPPGAKIRGRLTGLKHPICFYLDDEELQTRLQLFFSDGSARPSVARLLECVQAWQERYGNQE